LLIAALAAPSASVATRALADEKDEHVVKLSQIPAPAQEAIYREAKGAPILKVETEKEGGQTVYEAHVKQGNKEIGIVVDAEGTLIGRHSEQDEKE
jgi:uncharacterized membrane protein YkoI